ncbi:phage tail tape measure protein [Rhodopseudomonas palustris]|uniref:phage tail tape measure protein n=1 Tax=Rhodopseudomonas palustris TaxID=1076 RepID=UPI000CECD8A9|nr:phage tail tape measure protein [Rhodopseudomonas palustris]PPQ42169.1 phage tail tape measure protein [Rhodopseudomonas palustris]
MKSIEARAVISAADRTGGVFEGIARRLRNLVGVAEGASRRVAAVGSVAAAADRAGYAGGRLGGAAGLAAGRLAVGAAARVLAPAAAIYGGVQSVKRFADTDMALTRIGITADATDEQISKLNKSVRDLAFASGKSFDDVTKGLESLVAGGMDLPQAMPALPAIVKTAQAAGAEVEHMATTTLALNQALGISTDKMQSSFDVLVTGGKAGKFELKDMARYMASIAPQAAAIGLKGEAGLKRIVAVLQTIRAGSGTTEEAASSFSDLLGKMETDETQNKFKKFGIDIRAQMDKARKSGRDLIEVLLEMTEKATKGDLSKIPQLFGDKEARRGVLSLIQYRDLMKEVTEKLDKSSGSAMKDFARVLDRPKVAVDRLSESFDRLKEAAGAALDAIGTSKGMDWIARKTEEAIEYRNKPEVERARVRAETDRRAGLEKEKAAVQEKIRLYESFGNNTDPSIMDRIKGHPGANIGKLLADLRLKLLAIEGAMSAASPEDLPPIMSEKEIEAVKAAQEELRKKSEAEAAKQQQKNARPGTPLPQSDPRKARPWEGNILDLPPMKAELTGSAEVKGETTVKVEVELKPAPELVQAVASAKASAAKLQGMISANGAGSTGRSSPDAAPGGKGASGNR